jgi:hypothetical protein
MTDGTTSQPFGGAYVALPPDGDDVKKAKAAEVHAAIRTARTMTHRNWAQSTPPRCTADPSQSANG